MLLVTLGVSSLEQEFFREIRSSLEQVKAQLELVWSIFSMPPHLLINFEIQKYYQNEPKFNGVYSRNNLPGAYGWGVCNKS